MSFQCVGTPGRTARMGDTIWVDVQGRAEDDLPSDNSIMLRLDEQLDRLSAKLGVAKLSDFYDHSEKEAEFADLAQDADVEEDDESGQVAERATAPGTWFDPAPALRAVTAIRQHLVRHPADLGFKPDASASHWPSDLMDELEYATAVLEDAVSR